MKISQRGIDLICRMESCRLTAYPDPGTGGEPWTIGVGHCGPEVCEGLTITQERALELLRSDLQRFEAGVMHLVTVPITQGQMDALTCFAYNVGLENLKHSTLLRLLNQGMPTHAAEQFPLWNRANGKVLDGLTARRKAERELFLS